MRSLLFTLLIFSYSAYSQESKEQTEDEPTKTQIVEASCGQCNFGLTGSGCSLAVKIGDEAYYVDGVDLHDQGDAHGHHGMCNVVRKAEVSGEVVDGRYKATSFELLPAEE